MVYNIGFFKKPQGIFTRKFIGEIEKELRADDRLELYSGLDYKKMFVLDGKVYHEDKDLSDLDVYFWHDVIDAKIWKGDNYNLNVLKALEKTCVLVNSSESTRIVNDKYYSHLTLSKVGLPVAKFALVNTTNKSALAECMDKFDGQILIKPRFRGFGMGIVKITSRQQLSETVELLQSFVCSQDEQVLIEKYYENDLNKWISVVVFGNKVLYGYRKKLLGQSDWKIYDPDRKDSKGQFTEYVDPPEELKKISIEAKNAIGKDIICFDFIYTNEGYKIIDENGRPGLYQHCIKSAKVDIKKEILDLILSKLPLKKD